MDFNIFIQEFRKNAVIHRDCMSLPTKESTIIANKAADKLEKLYKNEDAMKLVLPILIKDSDPRVSTWAAAYSLRRKENIKAALKVLTSVANDKTQKMLCISASTTLWVWKKQGHL